MTIIEQPYTIDTFCKDARFLLLPGADLPRLNALAYQFRGRRINGGYIFTPHRAGLLDRLYRAGFSAKYGKIFHPRIPKRKFTATQAVEAILIAEGIAVDTVAQRGPQMAHAKNAPLKTG